MATANTNLHLTGIVTFAIESIDAVTHNGYARSNPEVLAAAITAIIQNDAANSIVQAIHDASIVIANAGME